MSVFKRISLIVCLCILSLFFTASVFASATDGTVSSSADNTACFLSTNYGCVNFGLTQGNVHITDSVLTGYAWAGHLGWINLSPTLAGVTNNAEGLLSGYAWGERTGWINFNPTNSGTRVSINSSGDFQGYAWSQNHGWLSFNCANNSSCATQSFKINTDWRPLSVRNAGSGGGGGGGPSPSSSVTPTPTPTPTDSPSVSPSPTASPTPSPSTPTTPPPVTEPTTPPSGGGPDTSPSSEASITPSPSPVGNPIIENIQEVTQVIQNVATNVVRNTTRAIQGTVEVARDAVESPVGSTVTQVVSGAGVVTTAGISIFSLFLSPLSFADLFLVPLRLWALTLAALGFKKRNKPWGTVYDSVTKQPLDPAFVVLKNNAGVSVSDAITDLDGRYGFAGLKPGIYTIEASKTHYAFPSTKLAGKTEDEVYADLYFGSKIAVSENENVLLKNIPLDPIDFDWNEFAKNQMHLMRYYSKREIVTRKLTDWLFRIGFTVTLISSVVAPIPYNLIMFALYIVLIILRRLHITIRPYGTIKEKGTGMPLSFGVVRIYYDSPLIKQELASKVCDKIGRYYCLVPNGRYYVKIDKKNLDLSYSTVFTSTPFEVTTGIIDEVFEI